MSNIDQVQIPSNIQEALQDRNWNVATFDEIRALEKNDTWQVTELPPEKLSDANGFSLFKIKQMGVSNDSKGSKRVHTRTWY